MSSVTLTAEPDLKRPPVESEVFAFPLERPPLKVRRRESAVNPILLPYFIAGPENRLAAFVARQETSVFELGNPILLVGPSGSGKTALALHVSVRHANKLGYIDASGVQHLPAIEFARRFAEAVAADDLQHLRQEIDDVPVLIIDDLHLITSKPAAQEELAQRIEARSELQQPTVLTCRRLPTEVRGLRPSLVSRSLPGLTIAISCPVGRTRTMLLTELALQLGLELDAPLIQMLDDGLDPSLPVRALSAAVRQVDLWCRMNQSSPCCEAIASAIQSAAPDEEIPLNKITNTVARYFRLKAKDLRSSSRKQHIVRARSLAMWLARRVTSKSVTHIGEHFGGRDHSTVLHAIRKTESLLHDDAELRLASEELADKLGC
ncbi:helix-turn-helix domain-containing protein [Novipirellula caenicola]|uniref:helix-turn-helix domain-containing protein n=1 Tax=Novipirellula caenicola TaxID=1536901 RepID=UPI0031E577B8